MLCQDLAGDGATARTSLRGGGGSLAQQPAAARLGNDLAIRQNDVTAADREARPPVNLAAVVDRVVRVRLHRAAVDRAAQLRIEDHEVRVAADGDRALPRVEPEQP